MKNPIGGKLRTGIILFWFVSAGITFYYYWFKPDSLQVEIALLFGSSLAFGYSMYFVLGALRGFVLIPVTFLIIVGLLFFPPLPLYFLTLAGILLSSSALYFLSGFLNLDAFFERKYPEEIAKLKSTLEKNELPIVISWSFFPLLPTDVICYMCGALQINFKKFLLGVMLGEGLACAIYIFLGERLLSLFHF